MSTLNILKYPDPRLHTIAKEVAQVDDRIRKLAQDMLETMYAAEGVGLAATQVNVHERVVVIDVERDRENKVKAQPLVLINPRLLWASEETQSGDEGCLSVPTIYDGVTRHTQVKIAALDENGVEREIAADGLLAICIQHEMDHLMGKVFVEYLSPLKRNRIKAKLAKAQKEALKEAKEAALNRPAKSTKSAGPHDASQFETQP